MQDEPPAGDGNHDATIKAGFASAGNSGSAPTVTHADRATPGSSAVLDCIGPFRILDKIGEGGMGSVYEAEQDSPRRIVALKVIRGGLASAGLLKRFALESEVLGRLQHPGIAQVYHAGTAKTDQGERPYFAMEYVRGVELRKHVKETSPSVRERLDLLARICDAVHHAHQKGVIHRDLKPGNILVDQSGQPKILDFGVARATNADMQVTTMQTDVGQIIGTLRYMSPEQVAADPNDLDTRSDVYALGVIAYEMLTGSPPYDLKDKMIHEVARIIREDEPTSLSLTNRTLRGDVETIVVKALEKDKERRYQSAAGLAEDIRRYLSDEPILARPPSAMYQLQKFTKRHKALVSGLAVAAVALMAGTATSTYLYIEAEQARKGEAEQRELAQVREAEARQRADELQRVSGFQSQMLAQVDVPGAGIRLTKDVRARFEVALSEAGLPDDERSARMVSFAAEWGRVNATDAALELINSTILKPAVAAIDRQFPDQPKVDASLRGAIAERYLELGLYDDAWAVNEQALTTLRQCVGEDHSDTIAAVNRQCMLLNRKGKPSEAETILRAMIERQRPRLGADDPLILDAINILGVSVHDQGEFADAESLYRESFQGRRRVLGEDHPQTISSLANVASILERQGKLAEAEPLELEVLELQQRVLGEDHPSTLASLNAFGALLLAQGKTAAAEERFRDVLKRRRRVLGEVHPDTLRSASNLAASMIRNGKPDEAESILRGVVEQKRRILGPDHPTSIISLNNLATTLIKAGRFAEAESMCREVLERQVRVFGPNHPRSLIAFNVMGFLMRKQNRPAEAEPFLRQALDASRTVLGEDHPDRMVFLINMGTLSRDLRKPDQAEAYFREAVERCGRTVGADHPYTRAGIQNLGEVLLQEQRFSDAAQLLAEAEPSFRKAVAASDNGVLGTILLNLGKARVGLAQFPIAEANLIESHAIRVKAWGAAHKDTRDSLQALVDLYTAWEKAEPDNGYDAKAAEWRAKLGTEELKVDN